MNNTIEISYVRNKFPKLYSFFIKLPGIISVLIILLVGIGYGIFLFQEHMHYQTFVFFIAIFILFYYLWWLIRGFEYIIFTIMSAFNLSKTQKINFQNILFANNNLSKQEIVMKNKLKKDIDPKDIIHWIIIPMSNEGSDILIETFTYIQNTNYDLSKIAVTLAGEERCLENFEKISKIVLEKFKNIFGYISITTHPDGIPGEFIGKGANITYSAQVEYKNIIKHFNTTANKVIVTTMDSDTNIEPNYPSILSYSYISANNRKFKTYQPIIFFFNNFWQAPFFSKIIGISNSFWILFNAVKKMGMRNFSAQAQPLDALIETDFWSKETIVEDGHQYRRSYFTFNANHECVPIMTKVYVDSTLNKNLFLTAKAQYNQMRRWAHGTEDIAYVMCQWVLNFKKLDFARTLYEFTRLFEGMILWATLHMILMVGITFTLIKDIPISSFISLGGAISVLIKISLIILIVGVSLQLIFSPWHHIPNKYMKVYEFTKYILFYIWFIGPTLFIFAGVPALHTQIALIFGKPFKKFNVTEKERKRGIRVD